MSETRASLIEQRDQLVQRLTAGDQRINLGRRNGTDTSKWETGWIRLLRDYERICRQLDTDGIDSLEAA
jgi:hypothetical protein